MYELRISQSALRSLTKAPPEIGRRIREKLEELTADPSHAPNVKKLTGHPGFRLRVGDWRVIYLVEKQILVIQVIRIGPRKEIHR